MDSKKAVVVISNYDGNQVHLFDTPDDAKAFCQTKRVDKEYGNHIVLVAYGDPFVCLEGNAIDTWCETDSVAV